MLWWNCTLIQVFLFYPDFLFSISISNSYCEVSYRPNVRRWIPRAEWKDQQRSFHLGYSTSKPCSISWHLSLWRFYGCLKNWASALWCSKTQRILSAIWCRSHWATIRCDTQRHSYFDSVGQNFQDGNSKLLLKTSQCFPQCLASWIKWMHWASSLPLYLSWTAKRKGQSQLPCKFIWASSWFLLEMSQPRE